MLDDLSISDASAEGGEYSINFDTNTLPDGNTEIFIRVCDCNDNCTDSQVVTYVVDNTLSNPDTVSITSVEHEDSKFKIDWEKSLNGDFEKYQLYHSLDSQMIDANQIYLSEDINQVSYQFDAPNPFVFNYFYIVVTDTFDYSTRSEIESGILLSADPVTLYAIEGFADILTINWSQSTDSNFSKYNLYVASDFSMEDRSIIFSSENISDSSFTSFNNSYKETYFFQVGSINIWDLEVLSNIEAFSPQYVTFNNSYDYNGSNDFGFYGVQTPQNSYTILGHNGEDLVILIDYVTGINQELINLDYGANEIGISLINLGDAGFMILSNIINDSQDNDIRLTRTNINGDTQWNEIFGADGIDKASDMDINFDGSIIITGTYNTDPGQASDLWLLKTSSSGSIELNTTITVLDPTKDTHGSAISEITNGYMILGYIEDHENFDYTDIWLVKWDENQSDTGDTLWTVIFDVDNYDYPSEILETSNEEILITGYSSSSNDGNSNSAWVIKTNIEGQGNVIASFPGNNYIYSMIEDNNSDFILAGKKEVNSDIQAWVICIDILGNTIWENTFGLESEDTFNSIVQTSDGGFFLTGTSDKDSGNSNILRIKTDPSGEVLP